MPTARLRRNRNAALILAAAACATLLSLPHRAPAIVVNFAFDAAGSTEPTWDPAGAQLLSLANDAASLWEDIIEDAGTINITLRWDPISSLATGTATSVNGSGKPTAGIITVDRDTGWWVDPTPFNDSEFDMTIRHFRDLTPTTAASAFSGTVPDVFEFSYRGTTNASAPAAAVNNFDLFSSLVHEIGHVLGLSFDMAEDEAVNSGDFDFDVATSLVHSNTMAIRTAGTDPNDVNDWAHIAAGSLMCNGCASQGLRRGIAATDAFAVASAAGWTDIDLVRKEYWGGATFSLASNWAGNNLPDSTETAYVRSDASATAAANMSFGDLYVYEASWVTTGAFKLDVANTTTIDDSSNLYAGTTRVRVETAGELETEDLDVLSGAYLEMLGGIADVKADAFVDADSRITGYGTVTVGSSLRNDGLITATNDSTLTVTALAGATLNLDGSSQIPLLTEPGQVTANSGNIVFNGTVESFNGTMTIGAEHSITFNSPWTLAGTGTFPIITLPGTLNLNGGATSATAATLAGSTATLDGNVNVTGFATISAPVNFVTPAVSVPAGATLRLTGITTYNGGSYTGAGTIEQNGNFTVTGNTTIAVDTYDWDGTPGNTATTINSGVTFTINSPNIEPSGSSFNGTIQNNGGTLAVNTAAPWTLATGATLTLNSTLADASVSGAEINVSGTIDANGSTSTITAPVDFQPSAVVTLTAASDTLSLDGPITYRGGSYTGAGRLTQNGAATVAADTTIAVNLLDWDGTGFVGSTTTVNPNVTLTINSAEIESGNNEFDGTINLNSGSVAVNVALTWRLNGALNLTNTGAAVPDLSGKPLRIINGDINILGAGPTQISAALTLDPTATVSIPNAAASLNLAGATTYTGGTYTGAGALRQTGNAGVTANTTVAVATFDLDGAAENSTLTVAPGVTLTINSTAIDTTSADGYDGAATLNSATLAVNTPAPWTLQGTLNLNKTAAPFPTVAGTAELAHAGTINASGGTSLVTAPFRSTITNTINVADAASALRFNGPYASNAGAATIKIGPGAMVIAGTQTHAAGATIAVNAGTLQLNTNADSGGAGPNLRITVNPTGQAVFNARQNLDSLIIANNASASLPDAAADRHLYTHTLNITGGTGFLDLADNDAIVDYAPGPSPFLTLLSYVLTGHNAGNWNGPGIRSSNAAAHPNDLTALAIAEASTVFGLSGAMTATFATQTVDASSVLIKYTYYGDGNLNGRIDPDDFAITDRGLALGLTGWTGGDYNYSGAVDAADFLLLDKSYLLQSGTLSPDPALLALRQSQFGAAYVSTLLTSVPEPTTAVCGLALPLLVRRRNR